MIDLVCIAERIETHTGLRVGTPDNTATVERIRIDLTTTGTHHILDLNGHYIPLRVEEFTYTEVPA